MSAVLARPAARVVRTMAVVVWLMALAGHVVSAQQYPVTGMIVSVNPPARTSISTSLTYHGFGQNHFGYSSAVVQPA